MAGLVPAIHVVPPGSQRGRRRKRRRVDARIKSGHDAWEVFEPAVDGPNKPEEHLMKRKLILALVAVAAMWTGVSRADKIELDLHDYDDDLMRQLEQTLKYFE